MKTRIILMIGVFLIISLFSNEMNVIADGVAQLPTVAIPTVTSSPSGTIIIVTLDQEQINLRSGPSTDYPVVGVLIAGQAAPALGRTVGGDWIQIVYPGVAGGVAWVYSPLVRIEGSLSIVEPPPTPTPRTTPTVDPTLAAQFLIEIPPTRLPTFTIPPPLALPTFEGSVDDRLSRQIPVGFIIIGLAVIGVFGTLITFLRGK